MNRRQALACAAAALLAGCGRREGVPDLEGGWVGANAERGHALRDGRVPRVQPGVAVRRTSVAVVGAGVAGLATARALQRSGIDDVRVFELEDAAGGNARGHVMGNQPCPLGAHYLPVPGPDAHEVAQLLRELGVARSEFGRTVYDERTLCHAPQERLFIDGSWQEGLLPATASASGRAQARRFSALVSKAQADAGFAMPTLRRPWNAGLAALDALSFDQWLDAQGLDDAHLRWYLDYCCRDDYGAGSAQVSAWAGLHYFASRHGFRAPGDAADDAEDRVLTWPQGNAWLTERMAASLGERVTCGAVVSRVSESRHEVALDVFDARSGVAQRWVAQRVVMCTPLFVSARLLEAPQAALMQSLQRMRYAPWLVTNLQLREPLADRIGPAAAWDNVLYSSAALGYVDAGHQNLGLAPRTNVLTHYWALGGDSAQALAAARRRLFDAPWREWADAVIADLARAHPDLPRKVARADLMRYGHAMSIPVPGLRGDAALAALARADAGSRIHFAHADLSAYSVFEEAFTRGTLAAGQVARALGARRTD